MKMPFDGWVIYDRIDGAWQIISIISTATQHGFTTKELLKAGLAIKGAEPRVFTHSKGDNILWRMTEEA